MYTSRIPSTLLIILLAAGCAGPSREATLDSMVGQDVETALETFDKPSEVAELEDGRKAYIWRRVYNYDNGRRADSWPERRQQGWVEDDSTPARSRVCSTRLVVNFHFVVESWDYRCETVIEQRPRVPNSPNPPQASADPRQR